MPADRLLRRTWIELRRRKVVQAAATYAVVAFVVLQLAEITYDPLGLPGWALTWTVLAAVLGFPVVMVLAWFFDVSRRGLTRDQSAGGATGPAFAVAVVLLTVAGIGWWLTGVYAPDPAVDAAAGAPAASSAPANAIAVLPFDDMSPTGDQRSLADGIAEELLDRLARSPALRVAARTSSFAFRDSATDIREIGRALNVRWLLEGSLRIAGGRIRITAQLIDAGDGFHVWSETYERAADDLFALQDEVTDAIAGELSKRIGGIAVEAGGDAGTTDPDALQAYLQGREAWRERTPASLERAETLFRRAVESDPPFARAWSGLADTYLLQEQYGSRELADAIRLAEPAAVRAVSLRPQLGEAWASLGLLRSTVGQLGAAEQSLLKAMELDPRYEMAPMWLANVYGLQGRLDRQLEVLERAAELNPLEPVINVNLAQARAALGNTDGARTLLLQALAVRPDDSSLLRGLSDLEFGQGRLEPALRAARAAHATDPAAPSNIATLARLYLLIEDFDRAERLLQQLPANSRARLLSLQELELRRGGDRLLPPLAGWLAAIEQDRLTATDQTALTLAGFARLRAGSPEQAARLLARALDGPEQLAERPQSLDAASLLVVALRAAGDGAAAERWSIALQQAAEAWLADAPMLPGSAYGRVLLAVERGRLDAADEALQRAVEAGFRERWLLLYDPRLAPLRQHGRLEPLQQRLADELQQLRTQFADPQ